MMRFNSEAWNENCPTPLGCTEFEFDSGSKISSWPELSDAFGVHPGRISKGCHNTAQGNALSSGITNGFHTLNGYNKLMHPEGIQQHSP